MALCDTFVRGIGPGIDRAFEQSVDTYIDGIYSSSKVSEMKSPMIGSIELLGAFTLRGTGVVSSD